LIDLSPNREKDLLRRASRGDEAAFTELFYAYHNRLGAYVCRLTGSLQLAEEIVQDVFMKVWSNRENLVRVDRFGAYIYILSRNHTLNCLRKLAAERARTREMSEDLAAARDMTGMAENHPDYYFLLDQAVDELPPQQQKAYILSRRERMKYDEIAERMNISRETVKKYLQLATRFITVYVRTHGDLLLLVLLFSLVR
jgi:RNA polymerase sigma-70 factor (ECF subfamily)